MLQSLFSYRKLCQLSNTMSKNIVKQFLRPFKRLEWLCGVEELKWNEVLSDYEIKPIKYAYIIYAYMFLTCVIEWVSFPNTDSHIFAMLCLTSFVLFVWNGKYFAKQDLLVQNLMEKFDTDLTVLNLQPIVWTDWLVELFIWKVNFLAIGTAIFIRITSLFYKEKYVTAAAIVNIPCWLAIEQACFYKYLLNYRFRVIINRLKSQNHEVFTVNCVFCNSTYKNKVRSQKDVCNVHLIRYMQHQVSR